MARDELDVLRPAEGQEKRIINAAKWLPRIELACCNKRCLLLGGHRSATNTIMVWCTCAEADAAHPDGSRLLSLDSWVVEHCRGEDLDTYEEDEDEEEDEARPSPVDELVMSEARVVRVGAAVLPKQLPLRQLLSSALVAQGGNRELKGATFWVYWYDQPVPQPGDGDYRGIKKTWAPGGYVTPGTGLWYKARVLKCDTTTGQVQIKYDVDNSVDSLYLLCAFAHFLAVPPAKGGRPQVLPDMSQIPYIGLPPSAAAAAAAGGGGASKEVKAAKGKAKTAIVVDDTSSDDSAPLVRAAKAAGGEAKTETKTAAPKAAAATAAATAATAAEASKKVKLPTPRSAAPAGTAQTAAAAPSKAAAAAKGQGPGPAGGRAPALAGQATPAAAAAVLQPAPESAKAAPSAAAAHGPAARRPSPAGEAPTLKRLSTTELPGSEVVGGGRQPTPAAARSSPVVGDGPPAKRPRHTYDPIPLAAGTAAGPARAPAGPGPGPGSEEWRRLQEAARARPGFKGLLTEKEQVPIFVFNEVDTGITPSFEYLAGAYPVELQAKDRSEVSAALDELHELAQRAQPPWGPPCGRHYHGAVRQREQREEEAAADRAAEAQGGGGGPGRSGLALSAAESYGPDGRLLATRPLGLHECNADCGEAACRANMALTRGVALPLEVFRTRDRSWGLRCGADLRPGDFVAPLIGRVGRAAELPAPRPPPSAPEVVRLSHFIELWNTVFSRGFTWCDRHFRLWQLPPNPLTSALRARNSSPRPDGASASTAGPSASPASPAADPPGCMLAVDMRRCGNVARFVRQWVPGPDGGGSDGAAAGPALLLQPVLAGTAHSPLLYYCGLYAARHVAAGEELTCDFGPAAAGAGQGQGLAGAA